MSAYSWQYSATTNELISANPILEMRTALDQALGAPPSPGYAPGLASNQPIKAIHIQELRDRVLAAWNTSTGGTDIQWLVADQLGTPRMTFDKTGSLANTKRHDYLPFGEELAAYTGARTPTQGYVADSVRQKFTSKERDIETALDYFGARYYASRMGRLTSTDPIYFQAMMAIDPQRFNLYAYARNNPLKYEDPTGERLTLRGTALSLAYDMAGGKDMFDKYFTVIDGEVLPLPGVSLDGANAGVLQLMDL